MKRAFRNWIIGKNNYIESWNEFRQTMLSAQYALISLVVLGVLFYIEYPSQNRIELLVFGIAFTLVLLSLFLHRLRQHCISNILLFQVLNTFIFLIASSESIATGAFLYLIPLALGLFSVFNYSQRKLAVAFISFSIILFAIALTTNLSVLPFRFYTEQEIHFYQLLNFGIALPVSVMAVYLLISLTHRNAKSLKTANDKLSRLNTELDRFVYSTSHDLRAPLLSVKGLLVLMETAEPVQQLKYLQLMHKRIDSLDKFITDITDYSRNHRLEIIEENVNVSALAADIWDSLRFSPEAKGIEFRNEVPEELVVVNDGRRMKVVLTNLISNAIHYHDRRKQDQYIRLYYQVTGDSFSLHIQDNGIGIAPELHSKIFDMFFRGTDASKGTGLGLYIVKETLSKLSGQILLQSIPKQGSTFSIKLPKNC